MRELQQNLIFRAISLPYGILGARQAAGQAGESGRSSRDPVSTAGQQAHFDTLGQGAGETLAGAGGERRAQRDKDTHGHSGDAERDIRAKQKQNSKTLPHPLRRVISSTRNTNRSQLYDLCSGSCSQ